MATSQFITSTLLILSLQGVNGNDLTVGAEPIARPTLDKEPSSNVIIPNPFDIIKEEGILHKWSAYLTDITGCVRLQAWRPSQILQTTLAPSLRGTASSTTDQYPTFWTFLGQTDCVRSEIGNATSSMDVPVRERIRVEKNDVIGFRYDLSNPIPYDVQQESECTTQGKTKQITLSGLTFNRNLTREDLYGFIAFRECRIYSIQALVKQNACRRLQVSEEIQDLTYVSTDRHDDQCWVIEVSSSDARSRSAIIYIEIDELELQENAACTEGFVEVREGETSTSPVAKIDCTRPPTDVRPITSGRAYIRFRRTGGPTRAVRFAFRYSTHQALTGKACTEVTITQRPSYLQSRNYPSNYSANSDICWRVKVSSGEERIRIEVSKGLGLQPPVGCIKNDNMNTCSYSNCRDFIEVRDGSEPGSSISNRWCDHTGMDLVETSSGQDMYVRFASDSTIQGSGFSMKVYAVHPEAAYCTHRIAGGTHNSLQSNYYPHGYSSNRDDCWSIRTMDGEGRIIINVHDSYLQTDPRCNKDWVEVRDGPGRDAPLLRRWCGATVPNPIITSGPNLFIRFVSDATGQANGFYIDYKQTQSEYQCTTYYSYAFSQSLELKNNGVGSGIDVKCVIIRSDADHVRLTWDTEAHTTETNICGNNYVEISDGISPNSPLFGRYCNSILIPSQGIVSTGNALYIRWSSDPNTRHKTIKLAYNTLSASNCVRLTIFDRTITLATPLLHGTTRPPIGRLPPAESDGEKTKPDPVLPCASCFYKPSTEECWTFETVRGIGKILFQFKFLELQDSDDKGNCPDYIEAIDGTYTDGKSLGKKCGRQPPFNLTTTGAFGALKFKSDDSIEHRGYKILVSAIYEDNCEKLKAQLYGHNILSPGYPQFYPHGRLLRDIDIAAIRMVEEQFAPGGGALLGSDIQKNDMTFSSSSGFGRNTEGCWLIESPSPRYPLKIIAKKFTLGEDDRVEIYDGHGTSANLLKIWDHSTPLRSEVNSAGQWVTVVFRSGPIASELNKFMIGYRWIYSDQCNYISLGEDSEGSRTIVSPGYDMKGYKPKDYACWVVTAIRPHHQIQVHVEDFELERNLNCGTDYMEIIDGSTVDDPSLRKWCGKVNKGLIAHSTHRSLYIRFVADGTAHFKGFKLRLSTYDTEDQKSPKDQTSGGDGTTPAFDLTKRDLALIVVILIALLVVILVVVVAVKCRRKRGPDHANQRPVPTIVYTNQPPAYHPGTQGAAGGIGIAGLERKDPLPLDLPDLTPEPEPEQRDNLANQQGSDTPPPTPTIRDTNALLQ